MKQFNKDYYIFGMSKEKAKKKKAVPAILGLNKKNHWYYQEQGQLHIKKAQNLLCGAETTT